MDRMTPLDAAFLLAEDEEPGVSLAISSIAVFEGPAPSQAEFAALVAGRLPLVPRYRQQAREIPLDLGPPVWVDDEHFDLDYHLRRTALPAPGGDEQLAALMGRVMSARLDRDRPLWEYWFVEGLAKDRWALISKVHHCMVDGISGTDLYNAVLDDSPEPRPSTPDHWQPAPAPTTVALTVDALRRLVANPVDQARSLVGALRRPGVLAGLVWDTARGLGALSTALVPASATSLSGPLSAQRRFTFARAAVDDVKAVRRGLGGTFNDVVLAAVSGGFRALLLARGEQPDAHAVRTLVPVNVRMPGEESIRDNRVSLMFADLPVDIAHPVARLMALRAQLDRLKDTKESQSGATLTALAAHGPFPLLSAPFRLAAHLPQRSVVTVTTNVPGPRRALYALGRPLVEIIPYVPIASTVRCGVSIFTYLGEVTFGVTGDYDASADIDVLARGIEDSLRDLVACAG
ncbi:MAG TPA: wax ester/triacylglycerol synthase family O-acyltransferase [Kutzneria sp.]|nr:wax ester/triacylglycerol synthase family O-acyltransferase [Kutzneria sp.]